VENASVPNATRGVANGVATLDADGKVPAAQLPSDVPKRLADLEQQVADLIAVLMDFRNNLEKS
jgi:hypothetical protein